MSIIMIGSAPLDIELGWNVNEENMNIVGGEFVDCEEVDPQLFQFMIPKLKKVKSPPKRRIRQKGKPSWENLCFGAVMVYCRGKDNAREAGDIFYSYIQKDAVANGFRGYTMKTSASGALRRLYRMGRIKVKSQYRRGSKINLYYI